MGAIVSPQSKVIASRVPLDKAYQRLSEGGSPLDCPEHWGGYRIKPISFEFWQGGAHRLHDRFCYVVKCEYHGDEATSNPTLVNRSWEIIRKAP